MVTSSSTGEQRPWWPDLIGASLIGLVFVAFVAMIVWQLGTEGEWGRAIVIAVIAGTTLAEYVAAVRRGQREARSAIVILSMMLFLFLAGSSAFERMAERL